MSRLLAPDVDVGCLLLTGEAGIGKTALWRAGRADALEAGWQVLTAAPGRSDRDLSYAVLGDLFAAVGAPALAELASPQRRALEVALLLREPQGAPPEHRAVAIACLRLLEAAARQRPVLLALDDLQWVDRASAGVLSYALRRVDPRRVRTLATSRTSQLASLDLDFAPERLHRIEVGPLSLGALHRLVAAEYDEPLSPAMLRRVHERSGGNPLHALELVRALDRERWLTDRMGVFAAPRDLDALVRDRLAALPESTRLTLVHLAAMPRPTLPALREVCPDADEALRQAAAAELVDVAGERVRFAHPLYATACYEAAPPSLRRGVHARLARTVRDAEERARQLALSVDGPQAAVALALDEGAQRAWARGAPDAAAELAELARRLTPADDLRGRAERTRRLSHFLLTAGEVPRARAVLEALLAELPAGRERAWTWIALAVVLYELEGDAAARAAGHRAIAEAETAGEPSVLAAAQVAFVERSHLTAEQRLPLARSALDLLEQDPHPDPAVHAAALREVALAEYHLGRGLSAPMMQRASELEATLPEPPPVAWRAESCLGECLKYLDDFTGSARLLARSEALAREEGDVGSLAQTLGHRAELALWLGDWGQARELADASLALARETGQQGRVVLLWHTRLAVQGLSGDVTGAREAGADALHEAVAGGHEWAALLIGTALGLVELGAGDAAAAARTLAEVDRFAREQLLSAPRQWRHLADYVAALVAVGDLDLATDRLRRLQQWAGTAGTRWPAAMAARAGALMADAAGDRERALELAGEAVEHHAHLPLPFDRARALLVLGTLQRRDRQRRAARESLDAALALFDQLGAPDWSARSQAELARISGRSSAGSTLSVTEQRVAELVAHGRSNREVAAALVITPRTVEAHLTRIYSKLGLRSRSELARRLADHAP